MPLTEEQKQRKNEKAKELRLKKKLEKANGELKELEANKLPEPEKIEMIEDPDEVLKRKLEIVEKRRKTLEIARSKRVTPTQIRKNNEEEMMKLKEEKEQEMMKLKEEKEQEMMKLKEEKEQEMMKLKEEKQKVKIIKKYIPTPVAIPIKKKKEQIIPKQEPTIEYLAEQSYAEQLQKKIRQSMLDRVMMQTFM